ncbi:MAG: hypothetical protein LC772_05390, partial [Chloroflexi bacterium]|nr:hypothetical protein [Chloroflexota bacterium]
MAAGPGRLGAPEIRVGILLLLVGFLTFAGLLNNHTRGVMGDGGDVGNHLAAGLLGMLDSVAGDGAAYSCSQVLVGALNLVGFLMVTDKPLMHWARLCRLAFGAIRSLLPHRGPRHFSQDTLHPVPGHADDFALGAVLDTSRTRRSKRPPAVSAADSDFSSPTPVIGASAVAPLSPPDRPTVLHGEAVSLEAPGSVNEADLPRPSRRTARERLDSALERMLPAALPDDLPGPGTPDGAGPADEQLELSDDELARGQGDDAAGRDNAVDGGAEDAEDALDADLAAILGAAPRPASGDRSPARRATGEADGPDGPIVSGRSRAPLPFSGEPLPPAVLLNATPPPPRKTKEEAQTTVMTLERTLQEFKVEARVVEIAEGPTLTRYEIQLAPGILVKKILSLADNIAMALAAIDVRVEAPIPGKSAIGVEIPKRTPGLVGLRELVDTPDFRRASPLTFALGRDVTGAAQYADLARMPHVLIAGSTGSGKSACLNTLITSILYRASPDEVQFMMIDPKRVELSLYDGIPHLCHQIVRDSRRAPQALGRAMAEMDRRYILLQEART